MSKVLMQINITFPYSTSSTCSSCSSLRGSDKSYLVSSNSYKFEYEVIIVKNDSKKDDGSIEIPLKEIVKNIYRSCFNQLNGS